ALGVYEDPTFGRSSASIVTQLSLPGTNPKFGDNPELDSVVLVIPYFSETKDQKGDSKTYELDSVFGDQSIKLSVFRSHYFIRNYDPNDSFGSQAYYTNDQEKFEENLIGPSLFTSTSFKPSEKEVVMV